MRLVHAPAAFARPMVQRKLFRPSFKVRSSICPQGLDAEKDIWCLSNYCRYPLRAGLQATLPHMCRWMQAARRVVSDHCPLDSLDSIALPLQVRLEIRYRGRLSLPVRVDVATMVDAQLAKPSTWRPDQNPAQAEIENTRIIRHIQVGSCACCIGWFSSLQPSTGSKVAQPVWPVEGGQ